MINRIVQRAVQRGDQSAVKQVTLTATQKTAATVASKVAIATATTAGAVVVNTTIQKKEAAKLAKQVEDNMVATENGEANLIPEEEVAKIAKKSQTKANVASGAVIGAGTVASTLDDIDLKAL